MKRVFIISSLLLSACTPTRPLEDGYDRNLVVNGYSLFINGDTVSIDPFIWQQAKLGDYPFTTAGELACSNDSVEFYPKTLHDDDVGLPLNQTARNKYKQANLTPNVAPSIKPQADLTQAIYVGLSLCEFNRNNSPV